MTKTVLVTGGAGYVGGHCCKTFAAAGWNVVVFDNLSRGWRDFVKWGPLIEGDIRDRAALSDAMRVARPDAVAHFAALAYVGESVSDPGPYLRTNVVGTLNLLDAMREAELDTLVFSSTCATYGVPASLPISEDCRQEPINPYGWSKLAVERMLREYGAAYGLRSVALRYFNAAGADPDLQIGERHIPETHALPLAVEAAIGVRDVFRIFGDDYDTPDGTAVRDYVHVADLASAHLAALDYLLEGGASDAFNLGTGRGVSVAELIAAVERAADLPIRVEVAPRRAGDPPALVADPRRAAAVLGWRAVRSDIDTIAEDAVAWTRLEMRNAMMRRDGARAAAAEEETQ